MNIFFILGTIAFLQQNLIILALQQLYISPRQCCDLYLRAKLGYLTMNGGQSERHFTFNINIK